MQNLTVLETIPYDKQPEFKLSVAEFAKNVEETSTLSFEEDLPYLKNTVVEAKGVKERVKRDRKVLHPQAKEIILNVVNFMKKEAQGEFIVPARKVQCRAAQATGFSERTVRRVVKESKTLQPAENATISFPAKAIRKRTKPKTGLDTLTRCAVRKIIHRIYINEKTVPTIKKIHQKLVEEIGFKGGSRSAHKIVKEIGFFWKKTKSKSFVLMEKHDIRLKRIEFLRDIIRFRHEGRQIVYIGSTVLNSFGCSVTGLIAGSEHGIIPGSLYTVGGIIDLQPHFSEWIQDTLRIALLPGTIVVIDAAVLSSAQDRIPTLDTDADTMRKWLTAKGIQFRTDMLRPELHQVIRKNSGRIRKHKGLIEQALTSIGHTLLKIPNDHPDLNPAALIWSDIRHTVTEQSPIGIGEMREIIERRLAELGREAWASRCSHVRSVEQQYLASEGIVDAEVERVLAAGNTTTVPEESDDPHDNNINFVRHFMGGLLGLDEHKCYT